MPTLYKTVCNTDWKGRPSHSIEILGTGTDDELRVMQDADVERWQADDLENDRIAAEDDAEEAGEPAPRPVQPGWLRSGERWEMDKQRPEDMRVFAGGQEGEWWSIVYHILP